MEVFRIMYAGTVAWSAGYVIEVYGPRGSFWQTAAGGTPWQDVEELASDWKLVPSEPLETPTGSQRSPLWQPWGRWSRGDDSSWTRDRVGLGPRTERVYEIDRAVVEASILLGVVFGLGLGVVRLCRRSEDEEWGTARRGKPEGFRQQTLEAIGQCGSTNASSCEPRVWFRDTGAEAASKGPTPEQRGSSPAQCWQQLTTCRGAGHHHADQRAFTVQDCVFCARACPEEDVLHSCQRCDLWLCKQCGYDVFHLEPRGGGETLQDWHQRDLGTPKEAGTCKPSGLPASGSTDVFRQEAVQELLANLTSTARDVHSKAPSPELGTPNEGEGRVIGTSGMRRAASKAL
jgi:hypothetical protein